MTEPGPDETPSDTSGKQDSTPEQSILGRLLYDEEEFLAGLSRLVDRAIEFVRIERSGRVVLQDHARRLPVSFQIRVLLIGRYFAQRLNLVPMEKMNYREIATELNRSPGGVSTEISGLVKEGDLVRDENGLVSIPFHRIDSTLREFDSAEGLAARLPAEDTPPGRSERRRSQRQRVDKELQELLASPKDLSTYAYVRNLPRALEKGLAGLLIAREVYSKSSMTCRQIEIFLAKTLSVNVTRASVNMAFLDVRGTYVSPSTSGAEMSYSLLPAGEQFLLERAKEMRAQEDNGAK